MENANKKTNYTFPEEINKVLELLETMLRCEYNGERQSAIATAKIAIDRQFRKEVKE